ncbi:lytic transglycosylase domain-containing protein [Neorhizobium galegae]|uniref:lytic transglycosylase domain-containing protein n=1 Tax=Neorhizobium galegae TaxID=399 RepID=UPI0021075AB6|nr:lytic transglycosylase domain-containing protein [Neorhizobium galegae]MCQ1775398.1 lytic transglycosylase domain-containing protein [Neorhizobium galegae]MCQ1799057.1 lytic transglycosylase domain-containing protein [Neorhizobium galegae]
MSESNCLEKPTASVLALAAILVGSPGQVQVPVVDNARQRIQQATLNRHQCYQTDTRELKGASGDTTDRVGLAAASKRPPSQQEVVQMVEDEAIRQEVDPNFALAIAEQESGFHQAAHSAAGAIGVMQLMPGTAAELGVEPHDICDNIRGGVKYIKQLHGRFGNRPDLVAAGYNAGPNRPSLRHGQIPNIPETRDYVKKVLALYSRNKAKNGDRTPVKRPPSPRP